MVERKTYSSKHEFSIKIYLTFILTLGCCGKHSIGIQLILSPMTVAPVCRVGDSLQLTCKLAATVESIQFLKWSFMVVNDNGELEEITAYSNPSDSSQQLTERVINSTTFTVVRSSRQNATPLISTLSINATNIGLNGTIVHCMDTRSTSSPASTTIYIVDVSKNLTLRITSEVFGADNVTVTLEWPPIFRASYIIKTSPLMFVMNTQNTSHQLTIPYNTEYNLTVEAVAPCGNATALMRLKYDACELPTINSGINFVPRGIIDGDNNLLIEGSTVMLNCSPGLVLIGSNSATCKENGEWEPDISGIMCNGTTVSFNCSQPGELLLGSNSTTCMDNGRWEPDPSQITCKVSCGAPEIHNNVNYSSYNSTLEGATVSFWCTESDMLSTREFISVCKPNANWSPDPIIQCSDTFIRQGGGKLDTNRTALIAGGSFGALVVFLMILLITIGAVIFIKKDSLSSHRKSLALNTELDERQAYNVLVHGQQNKETAGPGNIVYADVQSQSNDRSQRPATETAHDQQNNETAVNIVYADVGPLSNNLLGNNIHFDEHRVEYAQLNHEAQVSVPASDLNQERKLNFNEDIGLNLDSLLIQLQNKVTQKWHQFGLALGIEKKVLDVYLKCTPEQSIVEILDHWLRRNVEQRSWMEIARALRQINFHQLAEEIESIDKIGKLLIEVNADDVPDDLLHRSQFDLDDDEPPPPIPPKRFEEDPEESQYDNVLRSCAPPVRPPKP